MLIGISLREPLRDASPVTPVYKMKKTNIVFIDGCRTPFLRSGTNYLNLMSYQLGQFAIKGLLLKTGLDPKHVDQVIMGNVLSANLGQAPARQVALGSGMPVSTPATTINKVCGSSLKAVMMAANSIRVGEYNVIVAGGMESMTNAPYFGQKISKTENVG